MALYVVLLLLCRENHNFVDVANCVSSISNHDWNYESLNQKGYVIPDRFKSQKLLNVMKDQVHRSSQKQDDTLTSDLSVSVLLLNEPCRKFACLNLRATSYINSQSSDWFLQVLVKKWFWGLIAQTRIEDFMAHQIGVSNCYTCQPLICFGA